MSLFDYGSNIMLSLIKNRVCDIVTICPMVLHVFVVIKLILIYEKVLGSIMRMYNEQYYILNN